jgi:PadR family transcriptional regulator PadR
MNNHDEIINSLVLELRRGSLVLMVLSQLRQPQYGYSLVQCLEEKGLKMDPGTLYPQLRRLEKQGLLESRWDMAAGRPRRYYVLSEQGREVLTAVSQAWQEMVSLMDRLLD